MNTTVGGSAGGGGDIRVGRSWVAGVDAAWNFSGEVRELGVERSRYSGWEMTFGVAMLFGQAKTAHGHR